MQSYEDPHQHMERHLRRSAEKYVSGLQKAGLRPNDRLTRAMAERAVQEAEGSYRQHAIETRDHNIQVIMDDHRKRMNQIRREGLFQSLKMCPPIILLFGGLAWYSFSHPGQFISGAVWFYAGAALAFLLLLLCSILFNRPK